MRPRLEIRHAVATAIGELAPGRSGVTWAEVAQHAQVGGELARRTMDNMARAGELSRVGSAPTGARPATLYAPSVRVDREEAIPALLLLDDVLAGWCAAPG